MQVSEVRELIDEHRAAVAALILVGAEHELVERELAAPLKQVEQAHLPVRTFEAVVLGDLVHRLAPALAGEPVALAHVGPLLGQQLLVGTLPLLLRDDLGKIHTRLLGGCPSNESLQWAKLVAERSHFAPAWHGYESL